MEREYIAHHTKDYSKYLEDYSKHSIGSPEALEEMFRALEAFEDAFRSTRRLQDLATKSSGACQTQGSGTAYRHRMF